MSDQPQTPEEAPARPAPGPRRGLAAALPFVLTAVAAVLLSLATQALLAPRQPSPPPATPPPAATAAAPTAPAATATAPAGTPGAGIPPADGVLRLEILDLQEQDRQLWSALYLLRAASQIDDALAALQANELDEADRTLLTAYRSLDRAYGASAEQEKGPIDTFRIQISQIRDDLRLRPEGADRRLRQIRRLVLSLVDEGG